MNFKVTSSLQPHAILRFFPNAAQTAMHDVVLDALGSSGVARPLARAEVSVGRRLDLVELVVEVARRHSHSRAQGADMCQGRGIRPWAASMHQCSEFVAQSENPLPLGAVHVYAYIR